MNEHTVLITAENGFRLGLMADLLAANGIRTRLARDLHSAVAELQRAAPTMIIVDHDLVSLATPEDLSRLRETARGAGIAVLSVTEKGQRAAAEKVLGSLSGNVELPIDTVSFPRAVITEIRRHTTGASRQLEL